MILKKHCALCRVNYASFGARHENLKDDRHILLAARMLPRSLFQAT